LRLSQSSVTIPRRCAGEGLRSCAVEGGSGLLVEVIGETHAGTLMEYLVPAPWTVLDRLGVPVADLVGAPNAA